MRRIVCPILLAISLACVVNVREGGSGESPDGKEPTEEASKPNTSGSAVSNPEVEGEPPRVEEEPVDCPADADVDTYCTADGKLAGRWVPVDTLHRPDSAPPVFGVENPDIAKQPSLTISIEKTTLYIEKVTCGSCRRIIGHGFSGDLSVMTETQVRAVQTKIGLGRDAPLLDSTDAWRVFIADESGKATLTKLSQATSP